MGGGGGGEGFRSGAVGAGEDIFPDDLQNTTTPHPGHQVRALGSVGVGAQRETKRGAGTLGR